MFDERHVMVIGELLAHANVVVSEPVRQRTQRRVIIHSSQY